MLIFNSKRGSTVTWHWHYCKSKQPFFASKKISGKGWIGSRLSIYSTSPPFVHSTLLKHLFAYQLATVIDLCTYRSWLAQGQRLKKEEVGTCTLLLHTSPKSIEIHPTQAFLLIVCDVPFHSLWLCLGTELFHWGREGEASSLLHDLLRYIFVFPVCYEWMDEVMSQKNRDRIDLAWRKMAFWGLRY